VQRVAAFLKGAFGNFNKNYKHVKRRLRQMGPGF